MAGLAHGGRPAQPGRYGPSLRASDADRDRVIAELRERYAEGRLSHDTFLYRMDVVLRSRNQAELADQLSDLPRDPPQPRSVADRIRAAAWRLRCAVSAGRWGLPRRRPAPLILPSADQPWFVIGRDMACDLRLADMTVSRRHAQLQRKASRWLLADLGSTNGTTLNGWRVTTPAPVRPGDQVSFGELTFVLADRPGLVAHRGGRVPPSGTAPAGQGSP